VRARGCIIIGVAAAEEFFCAKEFFRRFGVTPTMQPLPLPRCRYSEAKTSSSTLPAGRVDDDASSESSLASQRRKNSFARKNSSAASA